MGLTLSEILEYFWILCEKRICFIFRKMVERNAKGIKIHKMQENSTLIVSLAWDSLDMSYRWWKGFSPILLDSFYNRRIGLLFCWDFFSINFSTSYMLQHILDDKGRGFSHIKFQVNYQNLTQNYSFTYWEVLLYRCAELCTTIRCLIVRKNPHSETYLTPLTIIG